jgi:hypothetical protein
MSYTAKIDDGVLTSYRHTCLITTIDFSRAGSWTNPGSFVRFRGALQFSLLVSSLCRLSCSRPKVVMSLYQVSVMGIKWRAEISSLLALKGISYRRAWSLEYGNLNLDLGSSAIVPA